MHVFFLQRVRFDEFPKLWIDRVLGLLLARLLIARLLDFQPSLDQVPVGLAENEME